ncbi:MAG: HAMP domain-containing protein [Chitinophagaceae bacterium]|nr:HAMP domain-containing protein [Chitinophagaceae bacterium]
MNIKTKLTLGIGLLFLLIIISGVVSSLYIHILRSDTENILAANYNTLEYAQGMLRSSESGDSLSAGQFENYLRQQEATITEPGEEKATTAIRTGFDRYRHTKDPMLLPAIRQDIFRVMDMNMQAIQRKSLLARQTAENGTNWIALTGVLCFLFALILLLNLPSSISSPIRELSESIKQIAARKYSERVTFENKGEFTELATSFNIMAEKLQEYDNSSLASLMMEKKRIEALISKMTDPVIGFDEHLHVLFVNEAATKVIGLPDQELIGKAAPVLAISNDLLRLLLQQMAPGLAGNATRQLKIFADNKESYFEKEILNISITPTGESLPLQIGHVIILRNITEYKELDFAKTNFIARVSHEFKTPISSMKMSLQLLANARIGTLNEEQAQLVAGIHEDANRLLKFTGELLDMTQVESGNIKLSLLPNKPRSILDLAVATIKTQAQQKAIRLEITAPEDLPDINVDAEKTVWVLTNLLSNAIRYSYEHSVISIHAAQRGEQVDFSVKDTGPGIAPKYKDRIFDKYFRVPGTGQEGTGLGLAICKEFMEAQGGQIKVESEYGSGSTFTVSVNRAA